MRMTVSNLLDCLTANLELLEPIDVEDGFLLVFPCAGKANFAFLLVTILSADVSRLIFDGCEDASSLLRRVSLVLEGAPSSV